jgi:hypothetical protein
MSNILITLNNFNRFSKRLQKILTHKFEQPIGYSETQEMLSQTLGVENLHEMQQALKKTEHDNIKNMSVSQSIEQMKDSFIESFYRDCSQLSVRFAENLGLVEVMYENDIRYSKFHNQSFIVRFTTKKDEQQKYLHFSGGGQIHSLMDATRFETNLQLANNKLGGLPQEVNDAMTQIFNTYVAFDNGKFLETCLHHYMHKHGMNMNAKKLIMHTHRDGLKIYEAPESAADKKKIKITINSVKFTPKNIKIKDSPDEADSFKHLGGAFKSNKPM